MIEATIDGATKAVAIFRGWGDTEQWLNELT